MENVTIQNYGNRKNKISRLRRTKKVVITGSNAKLLSGDLATHLTGRYAEIILYPFSFREFLRFKKQEFKKEDFYSAKKISGIRKLLDEYLKNGGFPEVFKFGRSIPGKIYEDVITKDILLRYGVKNKNAFRELANYAISNFGREISYAKLGNIFSIKNTRTTRNYVEYLSSSFLIFILEKFRLKSARVSRP